MDTAPFERATDPILIDRVTSCIRRIAIENFVVPPDCLFCDVTSGEPLYDAEVNDLHRHRPYPKFLPWITDGHFIDHGGADLDVFAWLCQWHGFKQIFLDTKAMCVATDSFGKLWVACQSDEDGDLFTDSIMKAVEVVDCVLNPDGSAKTILLPVPPHIETPRQAVAWTFGFDDPNDYQPEIET